MHKKDSTTWWNRRLNDLADRIAAGEYWVDAEDIAHAILFGRPKWGDNPVPVGSIRDPENEIRHRSSMTG